MSYNILHGATTKNDFNLDSIAGVIKKFDPDLVALQEVDFKTHRAKEYDLATELGVRTKMAPLFARAMYFDGGEYGEAILSKYSFVVTENMALPHLPTSEPRAALVTRVRTKNGNTIQFVGTHLDHLKVETDRIMQAEKLVNKLGDTEFATLLVGDLNAQPGSETMKILTQKFKYPEAEGTFKPTWPSDGPKICIDHILISPQEHWQVLDYTVYCNEYTSDHCAVIATLVYTP
ncbi:endonuclease/exonuclease/phosphatase family protein [Flavobacteriaceae bacterium F89]|uniref:Endonuclease/exonuclease/phosphatase family protein n=1 Tax=Cerina litoralis TaxID=2874477 RepID=A0AAE3EVQ3_9FLAO|nr:endonuclease/exonuclease/phosphatase family protein [Cerina litoralis]MCG2461410.1 endonuclease/exonuclease/phosphatase family protein [Cerina litoralis]